MREQFIQFLQQPSPASFLKVREALFEQEDFDPYCSALDEVEAMMSEGKWQMIVDTITRNLFPNHILSPGAHLNLGFSLHKLGKEKEAEAEQMISSLLFDCIKSTGDGTEERPYLVTSTSDEYDILMMDQLGFQGQALVERNGREYDVMTLEGGGQLWFDITEIRQILARRFGYSEEE